MLAEISPRQFAEWIAAYNLGLDPQSWHQTGTIAATIHNEIRGALYSYAGKSLPRNQIQQPQKYDPYHRKQKRKHDPDSIRRYQQSVRQLGK